MPGGLYPPVEVMQTWPVPNFKNPELRPNTVVILAYILGPLTVGLCLVRLWVRVCHQKSAGADDWLMLVAIVSSSGACCIPLLTDAAAYNRLDSSLPSW